jgi:hypothetical protein
MDKINVKKRGRKPKGGKIIEHSMDEDSTEEPCSVSVQNVILHLKCCRKDVEGDAQAAVIEPYSKDETFETVAVDTAMVEMTVQQKLKHLTTSLRTNDVNKKADCFWCTCAFDTPTVFIPKGKTNSQYQVYGSFCCPECAAAYIFAEQSLDNATKFERYHLLNFMYGGNTQYTRNILPAPSPYYLLEKFYGNMTIEEYRKLVCTDQLVMVVDKPICVTCPDIIQGNRNFVEKVGGDTGYRLCRKKKQEAL